MKENKTIGDNLLEFGVAAFNGIMAAIISNNVGIGIIVFWLIIIVFNISEINGKIKRR